MDKPLFLSDLRWITPQESVRVRTNIDFSYYFHRNGPWGMNGDLWSLEIQNRLNVDSLHLLKRSSADLGARMQFILACSSCTFTMVSIRLPLKRKQPIPNQTIPRFIPTWRFQLFWQNRLRGADAPSACLWHTEVAPDLHTYASFPPVYKVVMPRKVPASRGDEPSAASVHSLAR